MAMMKTNGLIVILPMFGDAAAPEIAIAVPRLRCGSTSSIIFDGQ